MTGGKGARGEVRGRKERRGGEVEKQEEDRVRRKRRREGGRKGGFVLELTAHPTTESHRETATQRVASKEAQQPM